MTAPLLVAPKFDDASEYSYKWALSATESLSGIIIDKLLADEATRIAFEVEMPSHNLLVFFDHGSENSLLAQGGAENILDLGNVELVAKKEVFTMACLSAKSLGVEAWKRGAVYWGYTDVFAFIVETEEMFCEAANYGLIQRLVKGLSWEDALSKAKEKFTELIGKTTDGWTKVWLTHDRDCLVCYDAEAPKTTTCVFRRIALKLFGEKGWFPYGSMQAKNLNIKKDT